MFQRAGYFHFAQGHHDPIGALKTQIDSIDAANSLIILPEAFNLGRQYGEPGTCRFGCHEMISQLQEIAAQHGVTFVAGLLESPPPPGALPFSAAYAIDSADYRLICRKQQADGCAGTRYAPCEQTPDIENPVHFKGACLMAMICMDIQNGRRGTRLTRETERAQEPLRFICICAAMGPAWFSNARCGEYINMTPPPHGHSTRIILANGDANGPCSFITDTDWKVVQAVNFDQRHVNRIVLSEM